MSSLIRIARITGDESYENAADHLMRAFAGEVGRAPAAHTALLSGMDFAFGPSFEIVLAGTRDAADLNALRSALASQFVPNKVVLFRPAGEPEPAVTRIAGFTKAQTPIRGRATAYVCTNYNCKLPTNDPAAMLKLMRATAVQRLTKAEER